MQKNFYYHNILLAKEVETTQMSNNTRFIKWYIHIRGYQTMNKNE